MMGLGNKRLTACRSQVLKTVDNVDLLTFNVFTVLEALEISYLQRVARFHVNFPFRLFCVRTYIAAKILNRNILQYCIARSPLPYIQNTSKLRPTASH